MSDRILIPIDGSPLAERALQHAFENHSESEITALYVIDPIEAIYDVEAGGLPVANQWYENAQERADGIHATARNLASDYDIEIDTATEVGKPAREILAYADEHGISLIIMGSHGRSGIDRLLLGSVAERVLRRSRIPVTVVR